ncbi:MAG: helix-turn-helix domain-containing protein [bacterium]
MESPTEEAIPPDFTVQEVKEALKPPRGRKFHRVMAKILDHTQSTELIRDLVSPSELIRHFQSIKPHMKHKKMREANQEYWEETLPDLLDRESEASGDIEATEGTTQSEFIMEQQGEAQVESNKINEEGTTDIQPNQDTSGETVSEEQPAESEQKANLEGSDKENTFQEDKQYPEVFREIGNKLRELRNNRDVSLDQVADHSELTRDEAGRLEEGTIEMTIDRVKDFARALDMRAALNFQEQGDQGQKILEKTRTEIDRTLDEMDLNPRVKKYTRIVLYQLAEDIVHNYHVATMADMAKLIEQSAEEFKGEDVLNQVNADNQVTLELLQDDLPKLGLSMTGYNKLMQKVIGQLTTRLVA